MYDFGLSSDQFWDLTPPQFAALSRQHESQRIHNEFGFAQIVATLCNVNRGKDTPAFKPQQFMPSYVEEQHQTEELSPVQIKHALMLAFGTSKQEADGS